MLTINERRALHAGFGKVGKCRPRSSSGAFMVAPASPSRPSVGTVFSSRDRLDTARGVVYGTLLGTALFWFPFIWLIA